MGWDPWNEDVQGLVETFSYEEVFDEHGSHFTFFHEMYRIDKDENGVLTPVLGEQFTPKDIREKYYETSEYRQEILDELSYDDVVELVQTDKNLSEGSFLVHREWRKEKMDLLGLEPGQLRYLIVDCYIRHPQLRGQIK